MTSEGRKGGENRRKEGGTTNPHSPSLSSTSPSHATKPVAVQAETINVGLTLVALLGLVVSAILVAFVIRSSHRNTMLLVNTVDLASELRQSSDDLSRFVRTYTVTGNVSYQQYFEQVIAIRDGRAPLPDDPFRNYWDLYISDGVPPRPSGLPSSLLDRIAQASFTPQELELLRQSKLQSDALIDLETVAQHAMIGRYRPTNTTGLNETERLAFSVVAPPNQTLAMELVHSTEYHFWKGRIMRPLDTFAHQARSRVLAVEESNYRTSVVILVILTLSALLLILLLSVYFFKVSRDGRTRSILDSMLPSRVVGRVELEQFSQLKARAQKERSDTLKRGKSDRDSLSLRHDFPVLYSEYLPVAWVAFTDVVGFTTMCSYTSSRAVISLLNHLFSIIDVEANNCGMEKIKTIGDAFMCIKITTSELFELPEAKTDSSTSTTEQLEASGPLTAVEELTTDLRRQTARDGISMMKFLSRAMRLANGVARPPQPKPDSVGPRAVVEEETVLVQSLVASVLGRQLTSELLEEDHSDYESLPFLCLRCGMHVGPVASGIVGFERPLYDVFGNTVNTAARLEAKGQPQKIHVLELVMPFLEESQQGEPSQAEAHQGNGAGGPVAMVLETMSQEVEMKGLGTVQTRLISYDAKDGDHLDTAKNSRMCTPAPPCEEEDVFTERVNPLLYPAGGGVDVDTPPTAPVPDHVYDI